jgi:hypothetical protein
MPVEPTTVHLSTALLASVGTPAVFHARTNIREVLTLRLMRAVGACPLIVDEVHIVLSLPPLLSQATAAALRAVRESTDQEPARFELHLIPQRLGAWLGVGAGHVRGQDLIPDPAVANAMLEHDRAAHGLLIPVGDDRYEYRRPYFGNTVPFSGSCAVRLETEQSGG